MNKRYSYVLVVAFLMLCTQPCQALPNWQSIQFKVADFATAAKQKISTVFQNVQDARKTKQAIQQETTSLKKWTPQDATPARLQQIEAEKKAGLDIRRAERTADYNLNAQYRLQTFEQRQAQKKGVEYFVPSPTLQKRTALTEQSLSNITAKLPVSYGSPNLGVITSPTVRNALSRQQEEAALQQKRQALGAPAPSQTAPWRPAYEASFELGERPNFPQKIGIQSPQQQERLEQNKQLREQRLAQPTSPTPTSITTAIQPQPVVTPPEPQPSQRWISVRPTELQIPPTPTPRPSVVSSTQGRIQTMQEFQRLVPQPVTTKPSAPDIKQPATETTQPLQTGRISQEAQARIRPIQHFQELAATQPVATEQQRTMMQKAQEAAKTAGKMTLKGLEKLADISQAPSRGIATVRDAALEKAWQGTKVVGKKVASEAQVAGQWVKEQVKPTPTSQLSPTMQRIDASMKSTGAELDKLQRSYEKEKDPAKQAELATQIKAKTTELSQLSASYTRREIEEASAVRPTTPLEGRAQQQKTLAEWQAGQTQRKLQEQRIAEAAWEGTKAPATPAPQKPLSTTLTSEYNAPLPPRPTITTTPMLSKQPSTQASPLTGLSETQPLPKLTQGRAAIPAGTRRPPTPRATIETTLAAPDAAGPRQAPAGQTQAPAPAATMAPGRPGFGNIDLGSVTLRRTEPTP
ncbi:hypothetical protein K2X40_01740 [Candidatus Babeliales bacterium]|nr:hypothetical protein [Candidatus Babeliales bacterium]